MSNGIKRTLQISALAIAFVACAALFQVVRADERHPRIHTALHALEEARIELNEAKHDFNGHRKDALEAIDVATKHLKRCLEVDK